MDMHSGSFSFFTFHANNFSSMDQYCLEVAHTYICYPIFLFNVFNRFSSFVMWSVRIYEIISFILVAKMEKEKGKLTLWLSKTCRFFALDLWTHESTSKIRLKRLNTFSLYLSNISSIIIITHAGIVSSIRCVYMCVYVSVFECSLCIYNFNFAAIFYSVREYFMNYFSEEKLFPSLLLTKHILYNRHFSAISFVRQITTK